jgi:hypothetical protein
MKSDTTTQQMWKEEKMMKDIIITRIIFWLS